MRRHAGSALLVLAVLALFHRVLLGETLFFRDLSLISLPLHGFLAGAVRSGSLPLWDPLRHGGLPALGPQAGLFSPAFVPYLFLPGRVRRPPGDGESDTISP